MEYCPTIERISMEVLKEGSSNPRRYVDDSIRDMMFFCSNPKCTKPPIVMDSYLYKMIEQKQTHSEVWEACDGFEPSPKWRKKTPCNQLFKITVDIVFKNNEASKGRK
jgi:hypothetical protein